MVNPFKFVIPKEKKKEMLIMFPILKKLTPPILFTLSVLKEKKE